MAGFLPAALPASLQTGSDRRASDTARVRRIQERFSRPGITALAMMLLMGLSLLSACSASRNTFSEPTPSSDTIAGAQPPNTRPPVDGGVPTTSADIPPSDSITLGERLGRLDALMMTAPEDSLPILQAEYERLLREATGRGHIQTGRVMDGEDAASNDMGILGEGNITPSYPRNGRVEEIPNASYDSALPFRGLRASELRYADGSNERVAADAKPSQPRTKEVKASTARGTNATARTTSSSNASSAKTGSSRTGTTASASTGTSSREGAQSFVNGVAASRAGWHAEAADELPKALSTPLNSKRKTVAGHAYGQALENTGKTSQAAKEYLNASKSSNSALAHKSYVAYCGMLAKSGEKARAKQLLVEFIGKNPKSTQVVNARQLLQTL